MYFSSNSILFSFKFSGNNSFVSQMPNSRQTHGCCSLHSQPLKCVLAPELGLGMAWGSDHHSWEELKLRVTPVGPILHLQGAAGGGIPAGTCCGHPPDLLGHLHVQGDGDVVLWATSAVDNKRVTIGRKMSTQKLGKEKKRKFYLNIWYL